eukprot:TRINITY_DN4770_c1_g3_i1.p1 TRINITY_DN4770_c1_g3~~TRINITY_DN4770_c1_g3_i1.p1  ORF type:complete len:422 (+),score=36.36 TRINITY_DN4770_c1_g3_i1:26-1291(+)
MNLRRAFSSVSWHTGMVDCHGQLMMWGRNDSGQLGLVALCTDEMGRDEMKPVAQTLSLDLVEYASGWEHTLALTRSGVIYAWGKNEYGQLGLSHKERKSTPCKVPLTNIREIGCGESFSAAVTSDGHLYVWGDDRPWRSYCGGLARESDDITVPQLVTEISEPVDHIACGDYHMLILTIHGSIYGWGTNDKHQLGLGHQENKYSPVKLELNFVPVKIACGGYISMALSKDGELYGWGHNCDGRLMNPEKIDYDRPTFMMNEVVDIALGGMIAMALKTDGFVYVWGDNENGQLGIGGDVFGKIHVPQRIDIPGVPCEKKVASFGCGFRHLYLLTELGELFCWGHGSYGQLGLGDSEHSKVPAKLEGIRFQIPFISEVEWGSIFRWLFLGNLDSNSAFFGLPQEVIYGLVCLRSNKVRTYAIM